MPGSSIKDWLIEHERKRSPLVFVAEWLFVLALAGPIWTGILSVWQHAQPSSGLVIAVAVLYASAMVYPRLLRVTHCPKCRSPLPFLRREIDRHHVRDREICTEFETGGEAFGRHLLQLYSRIYAVDQVRCVCRRCHAAWNEMEEVPASDYELVRTIDLDREE